MIGNNLLLGSGDEGYNLTRSLRFRSSASATLTRTPATAGNRKTWTWSCWVKRGTLGSNQVLFISKPSGTSDATFTDIAFSSSNTLLISGYSVQWRNTTQVFRDPSAWYHIVVAWDTTQATASNRVKVYVNGSQITTFGTTFDPSLNFDGAINQADVHAFCAADGYSYSYFDGYLTEVNFIDGQALTPSSFGSTNSVTGVWQPARYTGTYGTNGFYLPFTDNSALTTSSNVGLGKDFSGNGNYWTTNNISITSGSTYDSMTDVPTLTSATAANFPTFNPIANLYVGSPATKDGNLTSNAGGVVTGSTMLFPTTGKFYVEFKIVTLSSFITVGLCNSSPSRSQWLEYTYQGNRATNGTSVAYGATYTTGDLIGVAVDCTNSQVTFYKNNASQGAINLSVGSLTVNDIQCETYMSTSSDVVAINFGQQPFTYTPPTGFVALNTYNLPTSTIVKGNTVMDATTWGGDGTSPRSITNTAGFKPDLVWVKNRSTSGYWNVLFDSVRGAGNQLSSNQTDAELASASNVAGKVSTFNTNGFDLLAGSSGSRSVNGSAENYVGWQWQAGQGSTSSNTSGTITSTVSVNASAGFSVVTYTGNGSTGTVGHGLGVTPTFIIVKSRGVDDWYVYHITLGASTRIQLNLTTGSTGGSAVWNSTSPTSSVFSVGNAATNGSSTNYVAYCWTPIAGYSAFGSYSGSGSTDGPFIYTGFQPKWVLIKASSTTSQWVLWDTARNTYNVTNSILYPNLSAAEYSFSIDILSNGFKFRESGGAGNDSGVTYIYAAFATCPFKNSLAR